MQKKHEEWTCTTIGIRVQLEWDVVDGKSVNRTCSVQSNCVRHRQPAHVPKTIHDQPFSACVLLFS